MKWLLHCTLNLPFLTTRLKKFEINSSKIYQMLNSQKLRVSLFTKILRAKFDQLIIVHLTI